MERIIFDLDNTIISNIDFNIYVRRALDDIEYPITEANVSNIQKAIKGYEIVAPIYDKNLIMNYFRLYLGNDLPDKFIDCFLSELEYAIPEQPDEDVIETLEYLVNRYELYILTNWFTKPQTERLRNADLLHYFNKVYGGEEYKKPYAKAYLNACGSTSVEQVLMVGDSYQYDYAGAMNAGLNALLLDKKNAYPNMINGEEKINNIKELKKMF